MYITSVKADFTTNLDGIMPQRDAKCPIVAREVTENSSEIFRARRNPAGLLLLFLRCSCIFSLGEMKKNCCGVG